MPWLSQLIRRLRKRPLKRDQRPSQELVDDFRKVRDMLAAAATTDIATYRSAVEAPKKKRGARPSRDAKLDTRIYDARKKQKLSYRQLAREYFGSEAKTREVAKAIDSHRHKLRRMGRR